MEEPVADVKARALEKKEKSAGPSSELKVVLKTAASPGGSDSDSDGGSASDEENNKPSGKITVIDSSIGDEDVVVNVSSNVFTPNNINIEV